ncbi:MAG: hypothetical protein ACRELF_07980 [Gemmataceae bacterium]
MTWIKTMPIEQGDETLRRCYESIFLSFILKIVGKSRRCVEPMTPATASRRLQSHPRSDATPDSRAPSRLRRRQRQLSR